MKKTKTLVIASKQKAEWFGVYQTMTVFGVPVRTLEYLFSHKAEAEDAAKKLLEEKNWLMPKQVIVEPVTVVMHPWTITYEV